MSDLYVEPIVETREEKGEGSLGSEPRSQETIIQPPSAQPASSQSYIPDSVVS
jgi:hypothetical protein